MIADTDSAVATTTGVVHRRRSWYVFRLLRPQVLLLVAVLLVVLFTMVPPQFYERIIHEPDLMFANLILYIFLAACAAIVWLGIQMGMAFAYRMPPRFKGLLRVSAFVYLLLPSAVALALLLLTITTILHNDPIILTLLFSGEGERIKMLKSAGHDAFAGSLPLAMGVAWWALASYLQLSVRIMRIQRVLLLSVVVLLVLVLLFVSILLMARYLLMPTLFGLFLVYLRHVILVRNLQTRKLVLFGLVALVLVLSLFGLFSLLRGNVSQSATLATLVGYGPTSVNHLAAYLDGRFPSNLLKQSVLFNDYGFIYNFPFSNRLFHTALLSRQAFLLSFRVTADAGLNDSYIWFTSWGQIFAGVGWFAPLYLLVYGFFCARAWRGFVAGSPTGLLLYPWFGFNLLFTFGDNFAASAYLSLLVLLAIILYLYSGLVRVRIGPVH